MVCTKQVYICHDTITGIFSAIYDAWKESRDTEAGIALRGCLMPQLFCEYREVDEKEQKSIAEEYTKELEAYKKAIQEAENRWSSTLSRLQARI